MAQACHGALEAGKHFGSDSREYPDSLIVIGVKNQNELLKAKQRLEEAGIQLIMFFEPDWDYGWTAFGTAPLTQEQRQIMKRYRLWKV